MFASIPAILPEGKRGIATVEHFTVKRGFWAAREGVAPGQYARLLLNGEIAMSDTHMERSSNWEIANRAHGQVLIAGLGIGMILTGILDKPEVEHITVVEKYQDVIDLVAPHYAHPKLTVVCADIFDWRPVKGTTFDVIYFDIWPAVCTDNLDQMALLHRRFTHYLNRANPERWMNSWCKEELRAMRRRDRSNNYW